MVKTLRAEELIVEDVFCLLDREQGGAAKLKEDGITLHRFVDSNLFALDIIGKRVT